MTSKRKAVDELAGHVSKISPYVMTIQDTYERSKEELEPDLRLNEARDAVIWPIEMSGLRQTSDRQDHVYRVRGLPLGFTVQQTVSLISTLFGLNGKASLPRIRSLADAADGCNTVATMTFYEIPSELSRDDEHQWSFDIRGFLPDLEAEDKSNRGLRRGHTLTIDDHFHGCTILSSPLSLDHQADCLAISGLGGHAFGSFKEKGGSYMWLCDELVYDLKTTRVIIYGYESQLHGSRSFQDLEALATTLREAIRGLGYKKERKPLFFIAHSLGGLVVKQAIIQMRNGSADDVDIFNSIYGALFFGVPNQGMDIKSLIPMVEGQVNQGLLHSLSNESQILRDQSRAFPKAFDSQESKIVCFYETLTSPTAIKMGDKWAMKGPHVILVSMASATHGRHWENEAHHVQAINRDHSQMVKFKANDEVYKLIRGTLMDFVEQASAMKRSREIVADTISEDDDKACLRSLAFQEMQDRQDEVEDARADSCGWIITHEVYRSWVNDQHGLLWIKGKPGSGKSTLMKRIYKEGATPAEVRLAFFFHRRGTQLQHTFIGMLRTMSHQFIRQSTSAREIFRTRYRQKMEFGQHGKDWDWHEADLRLMLKSALLVATRSLTINIFIDALDEAGDQAESIISYLYELHEELQESPNQTSICFSCRHYPILSRNNGFEVFVENHNKNDISACVNRQLEAQLQKKRQTWANDFETLKSQIAASACGVFLWVNLVVPIAVKEYNKGKSLNRVLDLLQRALPDLTSIYEYILTTLIDDEDREDSLHLMEWICLAQRPLSLKELRYASALDDLAIHEFRNSIQESEGFVEDDAQMKQLVTSLSGGLAEVQNHDNSNVVQFIHQSVSDSLLNGKFNWPGLDRGSDFVGRGHNRLARSCVNYLKLGAVRELKLIRRHSQNPPFLQYAITSWVLHAQAAERKDIPQTNLIQQFEWPNTRYFNYWVSEFRVIDIYNSGCPELSTTLLHTSATFNLQSVVQELLATRQDIEAKDGEGNTALHYAARFGSINIVRMLLDANANLHAKNLHSNTALERAASGGNIRIMELLLNKGANCNSGAGGNALYSAASIGSCLAIKLLLDKGADINTYGGKNGTALQAAAAADKRNEIAIKLLLDKGADINAQGGYYGNALQVAAAHVGNEAVVKLLLDRGADINAQGGYYRNALQAAAHRGDEAIIKLLLDKKADINAQGGYYGNALQAAAYWGYEAVVKLLLNKGADINAQGGKYGSALQAAIGNRHEAIIKLLHDNGAVNIRSRYYKL